MATKELTGAEWNQLHPTVDEAAADVVPEADYWLTQALDRDECPLCGRPLGREVGTHPACHDEEQFRADML